MALKPAEPQAVVIFGASGDLTRRKLLPAFWHLFLEGLLPEGIAVVGAARTEMSDDQWRDYARDQVKRCAREEPCCFQRQARHEAIRDPIDQWISVDVRGERR